MKHWILNSLFFCLFTATVCAQTAPPNGMIYQAVARDASGNLAAKRTIFVQTTILKNSATGTVMYSDQHKVSSNADAMFTVVVGQGTFVSGTYNKLTNIPWGNDKFFFNIKICIAPTLPGTGWKPVFTDLGTTQFWSVPYALFSGKSSDSLTLTIKGTTRQLKLGSYKPIFFSVADNDSSITNEIQTLTRNGGRINLSMNGGLVTLPDSSAINELQSISRNGGRIVLNLGGGYITLPDSSATNELQTLSKTGSTISLSQGGGSIQDDDKQTLSISGTSNIKTIAISNGNNVKFNNNDADSSSTNELQTLTRNGGRINLNQGGGTISLPDSSASNELQTISRNGGRISLNQGGGTLSLPDSSATNEIQTLSKTGNTISLSNGGGSVNIGNRDSQLLSINASKGRITLQNSGTIVLADSSASNELQTISRNGGRIVLNQNGGIVALPDSSATNEIQTLSKTGNTISLSNGGGSVNISNRDSQLLSINASKGRITLQNSGTIVLADSSATNEIQTLSKTGNTISLSNGGGTVVVTDKDTQQLSISAGKGKITLSNGGSIVLADSSATNEIQTLSKSGNTVSLSNGGGSITVTDNQTLSASGTGSSKSISISGGNTINLNVSDADSSATNEIQSLSISAGKGKITLSNGGSVTIADSSASNELQTISRNGGRVLLNQNGGIVALPDSSATNEIQTLSKTGNTISLSNGGGSVVVTDKDTQQLSITSGKGKITLSNGGSIVLADSSATNEIQTISKSGNTVSLSNGGGSITLTDNQTISTSGTGSSKSISISGGNTINLNVSDADSSATNEIQSLSISVGKGKITLSNGGSVTIADSSASNELQTISRNGGRIVLNQNGGTVALPDSSATNEIQTLSKTGNTISLSNGGGSVIVTDKDTQQLSITSGKGKITLSNGGSIVLADSSATNEIQNLSISSSGITKTLTISNGNSINFDVFDGNYSNLTNKPTFKDSVNKYSTKLLNGATNPTNSTGVNGDFYINTISYKIFGPKKNGAWVDSASIIGPQGSSGSNGINSSNSSTITTNNSGNFSTVSGMDLPNFLNYFGTGALGKVTLANNAQISNNSMYKNLTIPVGFTANISKSVRTVIYVQDTLFLYGTIDGSGLNSSATSSNATSNHLGASATGWQMSSVCTPSSNNFSTSISAISWEANTLPSTFYESIGGSYQNTSGGNCLGSCSQASLSGKNMTPDLLKRFVHFGINISGYNGSSAAHTGSGAWSINGGQGGAGLYIIAKNIIFNGSIILNGGNGNYAQNSSGFYNGRSAAGGGGSCIIRCVNIISQSGSFQSNGGVMNSNVGIAGNGAMLILK